MDIRKIDGGMAVKKYEDKLRNNIAAKQNEISNGKVMDKISISDTAKKSNIATIAASKVKSDSQKEFSIEKFNALREKIKAGEYNVSAANIANAVLCGGTI